jgi:hypothetical protein
MRPNRAPNGRKNSASKRAILSGFDPPHSSPQSVWIVIAVGTPHSRSQLTAKLKNAIPCSVEISRLNAKRRSRVRLSRKVH